jgi:hypothetical protein
MAERPDWPAVATDVHTLLTALTALQASWTEAPRPAEAQEYVLDVLEVVRAHPRGFQHLGTLFTQGKGH